MTYFGSRIWNKFRVEEEGEFEAPSLVSGLCSWADGKPITRGGARLNMLEICLHGCCMQLSTVQLQCEWYPCRCGAWSPWPSSSGVLSSWSNDEIN